MECGSWPFCSHALAFPKSWKGSTQSPIISANVQNIRTIRNMKETGLSNEKPDRHSDRKRNPHAQRDGGAQDLSLVSHGAHHGRCQGNFEG